jgi:hypothetical protein
MVEKIFTPLNIGNCELEHRIVIDWGRTLRRPAKLMTRDARRAAQGLHSGGLIIYDSDVLIRSAASDCQSVDLGHLEEMSGHILTAAEQAQQSVLVRLGGDFLSRVLVKMKAGAAERNVARRAIQIQLNAARRVLSVGFKGIELDGTFLGSPPLPIGPPAERGARFVDCVLELTDSMTRALGRDRIGVRLAPFFPDALRHFSDPFYKDLLRSLHDLEVAYIHVVSSGHEENCYGRIVPLSLAADALRGSYPGILIATCRPSLAYAIELVESRWADAICFLGETLDAKAMLGIAGAWPDDKSV